MKTAFITGITGQDGSFLAELLLEKGYQVVGLVSKKHGIGETNIEGIKDKVILEPGDLLDKASLARIIKKHKPQEIYNLGGITFVPQSWENPELTFKVNALGPLKILEIIRDNLPQAKFYQATSAKIFGNPKVGPQDEDTPIEPNTPYAVSKAAAHFLVKNFRDHFNLFAVSGILYNHESERRGEDFVTRKITLGAAKIKLGQEKNITLGSLEAEQDWGYAPDYVEAMYLMLQHKIPKDFIIATTKLYSVKDVCQIAFSHLGLNWEKYIKMAKKFVRKEEASSFFGDASKAKQLLGWQPKVNFEEMIKKMVQNDLKLLKGGS
ncbi:GDP-mannose 4,6-dehydratase [Candidatus Beckwithbacteria bacterium CG10_big_fil_rev_8_21_14_0_10_34_10]|uniref:GDP-mannose 4,6-dehydratase n=1 Tax=Candidatus Beckwithbacteria bacterium CG10_big_fil_rev_8_21_14_0_10_34_10 TaxID=1974495 RepID=A0A2H0WA28_9BACT|nr:MAG: GDP-mannose 4,6-dehydratase [Candidatus Beckwithbacteria bacterium CG10_big_fil_rev_8_21_14_0_10_34_10]